MNAVKAFFKRFFVDASAAVAIEYAMICLVIFLAIVAAFDLVASNTVTMYDDLVAAMNAGN
jgi:Flp pilus assembly pilin Flp